MVHVFCESDLLRRLVRFGCGPTPITTHGGRFGQPRLDLLVELTCLCGINGYWVTF